MAKSESKQVVETGCNNVVRGTMLLGKSIVEPEFKPAIRRNNIIDNQEQCYPNNTVASFFQQDLIFGQQTTKYTLSDHSIHVQINYTLMLKIHRPFIRYQTIIPSTKNQ